MSLFLVLGFRLLVSVRRLWFVVCSRLAFPDNICGFRVQAEVAPRTFVASVFRRTFPEEYLWLPSSGGSSPSAFVASAFRRKLPREHLWLPPSGEVAPRTFVASAFRREFPENICGFRLQAEVRREHL